MTHLRDNGDVRFGSCSIAIKMFQSTSFFECVGRHNTVSLVN